MSQQLINGKQQFIDGNGNPLAGGSVAFYAPGTLDPVNTWQDQALTVLNSNPVVLDANGMASIWGATALYREIVQNAAGVQLWDEVVGLLSVATLTLAQINALTADQGPIVCKDNGAVYAWSGTAYAQMSPALSGGAAANFAVMPQVGGAPVVASGSNANGSYVKWAGGLCMANFVANYAKCDTNTFQIFNSPITFSPMLGASLAFTPTPTVGTSVDWQNSIDGFSCLIQTNSTVSVLFRRAPVSVGGNVFVTAFGWAS